MRMEKILIENPPSLPNPKKAKLRVAAYCRVSTWKNEQASSYEMQKKAYQEKISSMPGWIFAGVYADEGISGTSTKNRPGFCQMIADCENGKIDYIITKSISRFARNTLECLTYVRHLQSLGVQLIFEKENIDTGAAFSEMILTVLAAFAQEESKNLSDNLKWGIRKRYAQGIDRWCQIYGYTADEQGTYQIVEEEAAVVRKIFQLYEEGMSMAGIADYLWVNKIKSPAGKPTWKPSAVMHILRNEKYVGDIRLQKRYTVDHITHKEVVNDCTVVPGYYIVDHHVPIVTRETFDRVQLIRMLKCQGGRNGKEGTAVQYPFHDLLICPYCKTRLRQSKIIIGKKLHGWMCEACKNFLLKSDILEADMLRAYQEVPMKQVVKLAQSSDTAVKRAALAMVDRKREHPSFERVEFYWLDQLVECITFEKQEQTGAWMMTVHWKCTLTTSIFCGFATLKDTPEKLVSSYIKYTQRQEATADENPTY